MNLVVLDEVDEELTDAARWYEDRVSGLGHALIEQYLEALVEIREHPRRFPRVLTRSKRDIRRRRLNRFPYAMIYEVIEQRIWIVALEHASRKPGYWLSRKTLYSP